MYIDSGGVIACNVPTTNMAEPTSNLRCIKEKYADQPAQQHSTHTCIPSLTLLKRCSRKQLFFKNAMYARYFVHW
jgi:hypothetical protein